MKRWQVIAACVLGALALVVVTCVLPQREPVYHGKTLSQWMTEANSGGWPRQGLVPADEAIRQIGTNGFPIITKLLRSRDPALKSRLLALYHKQSLIRIHIPTQFDRQSCALAACEALGAEAKPLIPEVAKALKHMDPNFRPAFQLWLQQLRSDADAAVPAFIMLLEDKNNPTRASAAQTLGYISMQRRSEVIPVLMACRQETNATVRFWAEEALRALGVPIQTTPTNTP